MQWDFAVPGVPVSLSTRNTAKKHAWTERVRQHATTAFSGPDFPLLGDLAVSVTYFHEDPPLDVDNMLKPILDGLWPQVIADDNQVRDVSGSRRDLTKPLTFRNPLPALAQALSWNGPFVYIVMGAPIDEEEIPWIGISDS